MTGEQWLISDEINGCMNQGSLKFDQNGSHIVTAQA
jgi:hypothetical protein